MPARLVGRLIDKVTLYPALIILLLAGLVAVWPLFLLFAYGIGRPWVLKADNVATAIIDAIARILPWWKDGRSLGTFGLASVKTSRRVVGRWVEHYANVAETQFARACREVSGDMQRDYWPTPIKIDRNRIDSPELKDFQPFARENRFCLCIVGEGGTGKTSLALQAARWAAKGELWPGRKVIPLLLNPKQRIVDAAGLRATIADALKFAVDLPTPPKDDFIEALLEQQRILLVIDDINRVVPDSEGVLGADRFNLNALVVTARIRPRMGARVAVTVETQKLQGKSIDAFFRYCVDQGAIESGRAIPPAAAVRFETDQLVRVAEPLPALLVRLVADSMILGRDSDGMAVGGIGGVAGIAERFVATVIGASSLREQRLEKVMKAVYILAWASVRKELRAELISRSAGLVLLADLGQENMIDVLVQETRLFVALHDRDAIAFTLPIVAEHLAAIAIVRGEIPEEEIGILADMLQQARASAVDGGLPPLASALETLFRDVRPASDALVRLRNTLLTSRRRAGTNKRILPVGILHSHRGPMALSEQPVSLAAELAIEEVNAREIIPGYGIVATIPDGRSDEEIFAEEARKLIRDVGVVSIFGCWTSASRKRVLPVVEANRSLLWYPVQYEGYEKSSHVIYTGAAPNQQIIPALRWFFNQRGPLRVMMVGSDYVFPRAANAIAKRLMRDEGLGEVVAEEYIPFSEWKLQPLVDKIRQLRPNLVFNTINGNANLHFFDRLAQAGVDPEVSPVLSVSMAESEVREIGPEKVKGHYAAWNYFQSLDLEENRKFIARINERLTSSRVTSDPMVAAYTQIHLFALACARLVKEGRPSFSPADIAESVRGLSFDSPAGVVRMDPQNQHLWKRFLLGRANAQGQFDIVNPIGDPIAPDPFPYPDMQAEIDALARKRD